MKLSLLSLAVSAGVVAASPLAAVTERAAPPSYPCTEYYSDASGSVCLHIPTDCTAKYVVQPDDNCISIANMTEYQNFTTTQLYLWNPDITQTCLNLKAYVPVCINAPGYTFTPPIEVAYGTVVPASATPVPLQYGTISNCTKYEFVGPDDYTYAILQQNGITEDEFTSWNSQLDPRNPQPEENYFYCVGTS